MRRTSALALIARGAAVVYGSLALLAIVAELRGHTAELSLWWIDLRDASAPARLAFLGLAGAALVAWSLVRAPGSRLRAVTAVVCLAVAGVAIRDSVVVVQAAASGSVRLAVPVPLSALTAAAFAMLAIHAAQATVSRPRLRSRGGLALAVATAGWIVAFPLAQVLWFGGTDYRRPADAAVILGARVYASGQPSPLLLDRLRTGIELYREGLVPLLVMSGGDGADGYNEARVMQRVAITDGVPAAAILVDPAGNSTELTVRNSLDLLAASGIPRGGRIIAVSQAYHLPRVQLAYADAGVDVLTVPAPERQPIPELPLYVAREVPAFWSYLLRVCLG